MKRLLAIFAFIAGGFSAELAKPVNCSLIHTPASRSRRRHH
ncbi:MAG: hypothetical protein V4488_14490 [Pseudomonadota bacterium]